MTNFLWLILILVVVIFAPVVPYVLRKIDAKRQLHGSIPERKAKENFNPKTPHPKDGRSSDGDIIAGQARLKSMQNMFGPK